MPFLIAAKKIETGRRRLTATTSCWPELPLSQLLLQRLVGDVAHVVTSGCGIAPVATRAVCGACYTTPGAHVEECWEIKKLMEQFHKQQKQQPHRDGTPP
jgi:hypothetical protein